MLSRLQKAAWIALFACFLSGFVSLVWWSSQKPPHHHVAQTGGDRAKQHAQPNHNSTWGHSDPGVTFATVLLAVIGIAQAGLFFVQLRYMRKGMYDARIAAEAAKESADIAKIQAETASKTLLLSQDTAQRQLRSYVGIVSGHLAFEVIDGAIKPKATIRIKNFGQTPAYDVACNAGIRNAVQFSDTLNKWLNMITGKSTVFPQSDQRFLFTGDFNEVPGEAPVGIFVFGRITYRDAFGCARWTSFRYTARLDQRALHDPFNVRADLAACEDGNEAN
jgi:hypothetical protein